MKDYQELTGRAGRKEFPATILIFYSSLSLEETMENYLLLFILPQTSPVSGGPAAVLEYLQGQGAYHLTWEPVSLWNSSDFRLG